MQLIRRLSLTTLSCALILTLASCSHSPTKQGVLPDGSRYEGTLVKGRLDGEGKLFFANGSRYEGNFREGIFAGDGKLFYADGPSYSGSFVNGLPDGQGTFFFANGARYEGSVKNGKMEGKGIYITGEGDRYEGEFIADQFTGQGTFTGRSNSRQGFEYQGSFANWLFNGQGKLKLPDGSQYQGLFEKDKYHGNGTFVDAKGNRYTGEFSQGQYHGKGTFTYAKPFNGIKTFSGRWKNGEVIEADKPGIIFDTAKIVETALYNQFELIDAQLVKIDTERNKQVDVFFVGIAGDGRQDVFLRELNTVSELMGSHFNSSDRQILLANNRHTANELPMATLKSLDYTLEAVGQMMGDEDILFLYMTSHGSQPEEGKSTEFTLAQSGMSLQNITPNALKKILDKHHLPHQVVVISACYSGGFVPVLRADNRLVVTSSASDKASFGCSDEEVMTYFGDAFFKHGLNKTPDILKAFNLAKQRVSAREQEANVPPSEPQISPATPVLKQWRQVMNEHSINR